MVSFLAEVKFFRFWLKTMDYNPWFDFCKSEKSFEKVHHPKVIENRNLMKLVSVA